MAESDFEYTETEKWAIAKLDAGHIADFQDRTEEVLDPYSTEEWPKACTIRLEALAHYVQERGEQKSHTISLSHANVTGNFLFRLPGQLDLSLTGCRFLESCWFAGMTFSELFVNGCAFHDRFDVTDSTLEGGFRSDATYYKDLNLSNCQTPSSIYVSGQSYLSEERLQQKIGKVSLSSMNVGDAIYIDKIEFGYGFVSRVKAGSLHVSDASFFDLSIDNTVLDEFNVHDAQFRGIFSFQDSKVARKAHVFCKQSGKAYSQVSDDLQAALGDRALFLFDKTEFENEVTLSFKAEGPVTASLRDAKFGGRLTSYLYAPSIICSCDHLSIKGHWSCSFGTTKVRMSALGLGVERGFHLESGQMEEADFRHIKIAHGWRLGSTGKATLDWTDDVVLDLAGSDIGWLAFDQNSEKELKFWPKKVNLKGLKIQKLLQSRSDARDLKSDVIALAKRDVSGFAQPFTMFAGLFADSGEPDTANALLWASKRNQEKRSLEQGRMAVWFGIVLQRILIGYGIGLGYWRILPWMFLVSALGAWILHRYQVNASVVLVPGVTESWGGKLVASVDTLLPIIKFDPAVAEAIPKKITHIGVRSWFWFQTLLGWIFGSILGLALAGFTQRAK